jgi:hypothetical protein
MIQRVDTVLRILDSTGISPRIELTRFGRIAEGTVCSPRRENEGIVRLRKREACRCAARLGSTFKHGPGSADISLTFEFRRV